MIQAFDPRTGEPVRGPVAETSDADLDAIAAAAAYAAPAWAAFGPSMPFTAKSHYDHLQRRLKKKERF
jgi:acyl-CoA reductase-like NAD-dependent aldehyde dehydrogenase